MSRVAQGAEPPGVKELSGIAVVLAIVFAGCNGGAGAGSGNFDQARDAHYMRQWCDTVVGAYPALLAVGVEASDKFAAPYFDLSALRMSQAMPVTAPAALARWHLEAVESTEAVIRALESRATNEALEPLLVAWESSLRGPFPTEHIARMQAAANGITTCKGAEMTGLDVGGVRYGGLDAPAAWE